jgi:hypothetical protein
VAWSAGQMREERTSCPTGQASSICSRRIRLTAALAALSLRASGSLLDILPLLQLPIPRPRLRRR